MNSVMDLKSILSKLKPKPKPRFVLIMEAKLSAKHIRNGVVTDLVVISRELVTDAFVDYLVDGLQSSGTDVALFKFHGSGTGVTGPVVGDTTLEAEVETRDTGTQVEGASSNIYKTVATHTYAATFAITEHGVFSIVTAGTLCDRSTFTAINVVNTDQIEFTYELTCTSGG